jgi:hypothetical protein
LDAVPIGVFIGAVLATGWLGIRTLRLAPAGANSIQPEVSTDAAAEAPPLGATAAEAPPLGATAAEITGSGVGEKTAEYRGVDEEQPATRTAASKPIAAIFVPQLTFIFDLAMTGGNVWSR